MNHAVTEKRRLRIFSELERTAEEVHPDEKLTVMGNLNGWVGVLGKEH